MTSQVNKIIYKNIKKKKESCELTVPNFIKKIKKKKEINEMYKINQIKL